MKLNTDVMYFFKLLIFSPSLRSKGETHHFKMSSLTLSTSTGTLISHCDVKNTTTYLEVNNCRSSVPVEISACGGSCGTSSMWVQTLNKTTHTHAKKAHRNKRNMHLGFAEMCTGGIGLKGKISMGGDLWQNKCGTISNSVVCVSCLLGTLQRKTPWCTPAPAVKRCLPVRGRWRWSALMGRRSCSPTFTLISVAAMTLSVTRRTT